MTRIRESIKFGLLTAIFLGALDFYLGVLTVDMSVRPLLFFLFAYLVACSALAFAVGFSTRWSEVEERVRDFRFRYISALIYLLNLVYINVKLLGEFDFFSPRGLLANAVILLLTVLLTRRMRRSRLLHRLFATAPGFFAGLFGVSMFLAYFNYFYFIWPAPVSGLTALLFWTFFAVASPLAALWLVAALHDFVASRTGGLGGAACTFAALLLLFLLVPPVLRLPRLSAYATADSAKSQVSEEHHRPNIIWIVIDTARRDQFSFYGYSRNTTPNIARFSADGVLFNNAFSAAPWTVPSHASMLTGVYPSKHGAHHSDDEIFNFPLASENTTIAEVLRQYGYSTGAFLANYANLNRDNGFDLGFDTFVDRPGHFVQFYWGLIFKRLYPEIRNLGFLQVNKYRLSSDILKNAFAWIKSNRDKQLFVFINLMEPHGGCAYLPDGYAKRYGFSWQRWRKAQASIDQKAVVHGQKDVLPWQRQAKLDWVDCKLSFLDRSFGRFVAELKRLNLYDDALIILTSDHGHLYGEHHSFGHNEDLYNELIRVPLIVKYPKGTLQPGVSDRMVQTLDLMPEILTFVGIPVPQEVQGEAFQGISHPVIAELFRQKDSKLTKLYPERYYRDLKAIITPGGEYKYIQASNGANELFDLRRDPLEQTNIYPERPEIALALKSELEQWQASFEPVFATKKRPDVDEKTHKERLKSLGYIK